MENWNHLSADGMAINHDPIRGGIIDSNIPTGLWFVIFNNPVLTTMEGFANKIEAFKAMEIALAEVLD